MQADARSTEDARDPILIVGAGPTGLVLAIELARRGVPIHLIDQQPAPLPWDRAAVVKSRSLEIFATFGLADDFVRLGTAVRDVNFYKAGSKVASFHMRDVDTPFQFTLGISENVTERLLTRKLEELGGRVERGTSFVSLERGEGSGNEANVRVLVRTSAGERWLTAGWVVGTDGLHSLVRDAVGISFDGHDYALHWGVIDAHLDGWPFPGDANAVQFDPFLIAIPIGGDRRRIYFRADPDTTHQVEHIKQWLAELAPGIWLEDPDEPQLFHTHCRVAGQFRARRVLLAGDAAHACSPIQGHGMNTGIQDAFNLGWKLALVAAGHAPESLLDSYDAERRHVAELVGAGGDDAEAMAAKGDPTATETIAAALASEDGRRNAAIGESETGFGYDDSPIIDAVGPQRLSQLGTPVGYRVGDAGSIEGRDGAVRLHELLAHTSHTLFLLLGDADAVAVDAGLSLVRNVTGRYGTHVIAHVVTSNAVACERDAGELLLDRNGAIHARLACGEPCLCLVRPDGHLGMRCVPPSLQAVEAHLARIFRFGP